MRWTLSHVRGSILRAASGLGVGEQSRARHCSDRRRDQAEAHAHARGSKVLRRETPLQPPHRNKSIACKSTFITDGHLGEEMNNTTTNGLGRFAAKRA